MFHLRTNSPQHLQAFTLINILCFVMLVAFGAGVQAVYGATGVKIQPIKVSTTLDKGAEAVGYITLTNESDDPEGIMVETSIEDFVPLEGGSNINFVSRTEGLTTAADWIELDVPESFELAPAETVRVQYTVRAPADAEPGSHFSVVFFKALKKNDDGQLKVGTRVGSLFFITVPGNYEQKGEIQSFTAPNFVQKGPVPFKIHFKNTGTVHFEPKGSISIKNMFGRQTAEVPVQGQVVLPTGARNLTATWSPSGVIMGKYTATLTITDGSGAVLTAEDVVFYAFPIWYALMFLALVFIIYLVLRFLRRHINISVSVNN